MRSDPRGGYLINRFLLGYCPMVVSYLVIGLALLYDYIVFVDELSILLASRFQPLRSTRPNGRVDGDMRALGFQPDRYLLSLLAFHQVLLVLKVLFLG